MDTCFEHWNSGRVSFNADGHPDFAIDGPAAPGADAWFALSARLAEARSLRPWTLSIGGWVRPVPMLPEAEVARRLHHLKLRCLYDAFTVPITVADRSGRPHLLQCPVWVNLRTGRSDVWHPHTGWRCGPTRCAPVEAEFETHALSTEPVPAARIRAA